MDAVLSTCQAAAQYLDKPPAAIIPHGINTNVYFPTENRQASWKELDLPGTWGIGILGRVRKQKGVHLFVRACIATLPAHPDLTAVIVGAITKDNENFVTQLQQEIKDAGLNERILFLGGTTPLISYPSFLEVYPWLPH